MIALALATPAEARWAHTQVVEHHYLHRPVDARCSVLTYLVTLHGEPVGCLMFGRPESTACYQGACTYGSLADVERGRAHYSRWELLNLARVWLDPAIQRGGRWFVPNAATRAIGMATKRVVYDYLAHFHPVTLDAPWELRQVTISWLWIADSARATLLHQQAEYSLALNRSTLERETRSGF